MCELQEADLLWTTTNKQKSGSPMCETKNVFWLSWINPAQSEVQLSVKENLMLQHGSLHGPTHTPGLCFPLADPVPTRTRLHPGPCPGLAKALCSPPGPWLGSGQQPYRKALGHNGCSTLLQLNPVALVVPRRTSWQHRQEAGLGCSASWLFTTLEVTGLSMSLHKCWGDVGQKSLPWIWKKTCLHFWMCSMDITKECLIIVRLLIRNDISIGCNWLSIFVNVWKFCTFCFLKVHIY